LDDRRQPPASRTISIEATTLKSDDGKEQQPDMPTNGAPRVPIVIETPLGEIAVEIDVEAAPGTAANFLAYVDGGSYDGGVFHRTVTMANQPHNDVKIEVIQGGFSAEYPREGGTAIALERTSVSGLRHLDGTISMARMTPDSAVSDFFICIGDQPELNFGGRRNPDGQGFAAFGRVTTGMDVVRAIQQSPHVEQRLTPPVPIRRIRRPSSRRAVFEQKRSSHRNDR
jgi:peptidyl-prolyl cis-trans isomerase A (cyclophilin A)